MKERPRVLMCVWDREIDPWGLLAGQLSLFNDSRPVRPAHREVAGSSGTATQG